MATTVLVSSEWWQKSLVSWLWRGGRVCLPRFVIWYAFGKGLIPVTPTKLRPLCWLQCGLDQTLEVGILNPSILKSVCQSLPFLKKALTSKGWAGRLGCFCKKSNLSHPLKYIVSVSSNLCNSRPNFRTPPALFSLLGSRICCMNCSYRVLEVQVWWRNTWTIKSAEGRVISNSCLQRGGTWSADCTKSGAQRDLNCFSSLGIWRSVGFLIHARCSCLKAVGFIL